MKTKTFTLISVLIALSVVGSFIQIPSPAGTVAFDSLPGYVAAGVFGPVVGGFVGTIGHLLNASLKGFPLTLPIHLLISCFMFLAMVAFGFFYKKNKTVAIVTATLINGPFSLVPFVFIIGPEFVVAMLIPLTVASFVNILIAAIIVPSLKRING